MEKPNNPIIVELLPEFVENWLKEAKEILPTILKEKDKDALYKFGHTLKGSCLQFGFESANS